MQWGDDRSLYLVKTVFAIELWQLLIRKNKSNFWLSHRRTLNGTILVSVSYRLVPYLTLAFSHQALNLSYAWHIAHACARYVILLEKQPNNKWLCSCRIPCFSGKSTYLYHCVLRLYDFTSREIIQQQWESKSSFIYQFSSSCWYCFTQLLLSTTVIHVKSPSLVRCFKNTFLKQSLEHHSV